MIDSRKKNRPSVIEAGSGSNRRRLPRYSADLRVRIVLPTPVSVIVHARTHDLSMGGVSVILPEKITGTAVVMVGFNIPGALNRVWFRARLCHRVGFRCGFQFIATSTEQRAMLRLLCSMSH
jgi:hypothetical protein